MAVQAYELIENINLDGLFHLGLMNLVMENKKDVMSFAERIKNKIPNHLLGLFLEYKVAALMQDASHYLLILTQTRPLFVLIKLKKNSEISLT